MDKDKTLTHIYNKILDHYFSEVAFPVESNGLNEVQK